MSNLTTVLGKIEVPQGPQLENAWELDRAVIGSLPAVDEYPFLCRSMFALNPKIPAYGSRIIHFAAAMKGVEESWPEWVEKLEGLLRRLSWLSVVVHLETESFGDYSFWWVATNPNPPRPVTSPDFSPGGPRFEDMSANLTNWLHPACLPCEQPVLFGSWPTLALHLDRIP